MRLIKEILGKFGFKFHNLYFIKQDLRAPVKNIEPAIEIIIKKADEDDLSAIEQILAEPYSSYHQRYLNLKGICLMARQGEGIAGFVWHNVGEIFIGGRVLKKLSSDYACAYGGFVFPKYRGQKVFESLIEAQAIFARDNGARWLVNFADFNNPAAYRARNKFGVTKKRVFIVELPFLRALVFGKIK